eukprot:g5845.t1
MVLSLAREGTPAMRRAGLAPLVAILVVLATLRLGAGMTDNPCENEDLACLNDEICSDCILGFEAGTECTEYVFDETNTCAHEVSYCCAANEAEAGLEKCLDNLITQEYMDCNLAEVGCSYFNMPCYKCDVVDSAGDPETTTTSSVDVLSSSAPRRASTAGVAAAASAAIALVVSFTAKSDGDSLWGL